MEERLNFGGTGQRSPVEREEERELEQDCNPLVIESQQLHVQRMLCNDARWSH